MTLSGDHRVVLVHGATSGPWVFDEWAFEGWADVWPDATVRIPDLQAGLDVAHATMSDYVDRVLDAVGDRPSVLCGWSMGGLVAMMAAERCESDSWRRTPTALVVIEPSVPSQIDSGDPYWPLESGTYDAASTYGLSVPGMRHRPESLWARAERKRGISIPTVPCPMLVVAGHDFAPTRGRPVAEYYGAELVEFPELSHFELVVHPQVRDAIAQWVASVVSD